MTYDLKHWTVINISLERTKEFRTLCALGITRLKLALLVLQEMLIITLLDIIVAFGLTILSVEVVQPLGLQYTPQEPTASHPIEFYFIPSKIILLLLPIVSIVVISCLYPIIKIAQLKAAKITLFEKI